MNAHLVVAALFLHCAVSDAEEQRLVATPFVEASYWAEALRRPAPMRIFAYASVNASSHFITNYGLNVENQGVMVQPQVSLHTHVYTNPLGVLSDVLLTVGGWTTWNSKAGGVAPGHFREVDLFNGLTLTISDILKFGVFCTSYLSQTQSFRTSWDLATSVSLDDSRWMGRFALNPFFEFRRQLEGRNNVAIYGTSPNESHQFKMGVVPGVLCANRIKLEAPMFFTVVPNGFYQRRNGSSASGGVGFAGVGFRGSVPIGALSIGRGLTNLYAGVQYYRFLNEGLLDSNAILNAVNSAQSDLVQFNAGITAAF